MTPVDGAGDRENEMQAVDHDRKRREDDLRDAAFEPDDAAGVSIEAAIDRAEPVESVESALPTTELSEHPHFGEPKTLTKRTLAEILVSLAADTTRQRVSVADLVTAMQAGDGPDPALLSTLRRIGIQPPSANSPTVS